MLTVDVSDKSAKVDLSATFNDKSVQVVQDKYLHFIESEREFISMTSLDSFQFLQKSENIVNIVVP